MIRKLALAGSILVASFTMATFAPTYPPACPTEDSVSCYWDGGANGKGQSFVVDANENVTYLP